MTDASAESRILKSAFARLTGTYTPPEHKSVGFTDFKRAMFARYEHPAHLALVDGVLEEVARYVETGGREGEGRVRFEMPPRHGKSFTISRMFPAWFLGRFPDKRVILASYAAHLSEKFSRQARNLLMSSRYEQLFPGIVLASGSKAADAWNIARREGGLDAVGVGSGVTGKGAHLVIADDILSGREAAESETQLEKVWDWFTDDLYSRLEPGGAVVMVGTRWSLDDPSGRLEREQPGRWRVIRLRAIAEGDDILGRAEGEPLWAERYPLAVLEDIHRMMGDYSWSALYQQHPVLAEGGLFKRYWFDPWIEKVPTLHYAVRFWDLAMSERETADYTVGVKIGGGEDGHYYVLDVARRRVDMSQLADFMASVMLEDGKSVPQGVEETGYQSRVIQDLNVDPRLMGHGIFGYPVDRNKMVRALAPAAKFGAGVLHVVNAGWTQGYVDELCAFTGRADLHDDQVDATSGAWAMAEAASGDAAGVVNYGAFDDRSAY